MAKSFKVELIVPEGLVGGDTFTAVVEMPAKVKKERGQLFGIALTEMTDEQLKREIINANSVLYKAKQRGAAPETIAANEARVEAAKAEKAKRFPVASVVIDEAMSEILSEDIAEEI